MSVTLQQRLLSHTVNPGYAFSFSESLAKSISPSSVWDTVLKDISDGNRERQPTSVSGLHTCMHKWVHAHTHAWEYTENLKDFKGMYNIKIKKTGIYIDLARVEVEK